MFANHENSIFITNDLLYDKIDYIQYEKANKIKLL